MIQETVFQFLMIYFEEESVLQIWLKVFWIELYADTYV